MIVGRVSRIMCVLALVPAVAGAQRGGMGGMGRGGRTPSIAHEDALQIPKIVNGVNLLIEHRQELALTDSQFKRIIFIKRGLDSTNAPLMRSLDSVQHLFKGGGIRFGSPSAAQRDSLAEAHAMVSATQVAIRSNIADWHDKAFSVLSFTQMTKAQAIEDKEAQAIAEEAAKGKGRGG